MLRPTDVADLVCAALRHAATLHPDDAYEILAIARRESQRAEEALIERWDTDRVVRRWSLETR